MVHGFIKLWLQGKVTDDGGCSKFIGPDHKSNNNNDKPLKSGLSGKAGFKVIQKFFNIFKHDVWSYTGKCGKLNVR